MDRFISEREDVLNSIDQARAQLQACLRPHHYTLGNQQVDRRITLLVGQLKQLYSDVRLLEDET